MSKKFVEAEPTISKKVLDIKVGDRVDLKSCPTLKNHTSAIYEYAVVSEIEKETSNCRVIYYEGIKGVGYAPSQILKIAV